jgi:hypothetical protein
MAYSIRKEIDIILKLAYPYQEKLNQIIKHESDIGKEQKNNSEKKSVSEFVDENKDDGFIPLKVSEFMKSDKK